MRGEQTFVPLPVCAIAGSPPLARGTAPAVRLSCCLAGITPACAGNRRNHHSRRRRRGDHPRLRGEQLLLRQEYIQMEGSPPLARGTEYAPCSGRGEGRITPACAGNSPRSLCRSAASRDHPRLRGEQDKNWMCRPYTVGSPPLARGTAVTSGE